MIKRLLRRRKQRRPKRTSFWRMFAVGMILPVLITVILGNYSSYIVTLRGVGYRFEKEEQS